MEHYGRDFYARRREITSLSAGIVFSHLFTYFKPRTAIDFGCGTGIWLAEAIRHDVRVVHGVDGPWVNKVDLEIPLDCFEVTDLGSVAYKPKTRYELAICIEVAEHLSEPMGTKLVDSLVASSDIVLFSAAVIGQGGTGHVNEQPQTYWYKKFASRGYRCLDIVRPSIWNSQEVNIIYKQNMLLYVRSDVLKEKFTGCEDVSDSYQLDRVHPKLLEIRSVATGGGPQQTKHPKLLKLFNRLFK